MNEFLVLLKKDFRLLFTDSYFAIVLVAMFVLSSVALISVAADYTSYTQNPPIPLSFADKELKQRSCLLDYWNIVIPIGALVILVVSSLSFSLEKESGMMRFILSYGKSRSLFFFSKSVIVIMVCALVTAIPVIVFLLGFYVLGLGPLVDGQLVLASSLFPLLIMLIVSMLGILISSLNKKRHTAVIIAVLAFLIITTMYSYAIENGMNDARAEFNREHSDDGMTMSISDARALFPTDKKMTLLFNPMLLKEGLPSMLNLTGKEIDPVNEGTFTFHGTDTDMEIGITTAASLFLLGYISFILGERGRYRWPSTKNQ